MKKILLAVIIIAMSVQLVACTNETETPLEETPVYNTNTTTAEAITTAPPEVTIPAETTEDNWAEDYERYKAMYYDDEVLADFSGVSITQESPKSVNPAFSSLNFREKSLMTYDMASDTLYYVNYKHDDFLYAHKDGERELLVEMPVNFPNYYNGDIYFLSDGKTMPSIYSDLWGGSLYKYSISDKTVSTLSDGYFLNLSIYGDYMYFSEGFDGEEPGRRSFRMKIGGTEIEDIGYATQYFYGEYQLAFEPVSEPAEAYPDMARTFARLVLVSGDEVVPLTGVGSYWMESFCISGDEFWLLEGDVLYCMNLASGKTKTYTAKTYVTDAGKWIMSGIGKFTVMDGVLYVGHTNNMCVFWYDDETEQFMPIELGHLGAAHFDVYTNGTDIYAFSQALLSDWAQISKYTPTGNGTYRKTMIYE